MKKVIKGVAVIILIPTLLFAIFLIYSTVVDFKPKPIEKINEATGTVINVYDTLNVFNWNIGYCGLGDDMSFFYDGGDKVRTTKDRTLINLNGIKNTLLKHDSIDFYLLQEIDRKSRRSYKINQLDSISECLATYNMSFALNYNVAFVPVPPNNPLGKVDGGLASYSKSEPFKTSRFSFPGNYAWPKGLFLLDRCFMVQRFYTSNGKELLIINTHNSAYDDGSLRIKQMEVMKTFLIEEYNKGNYVLVGGDWNQNAPKDGAELNGGKEGRLTRLRIGENFMPEGWDWQYCEKTPTNRMIDEVYNPETTITTTIDFYLLSPNLKAIIHKNIDLKFENSDHQPVLLSFAFLH
ncbi:MAG: hypothetical protein PF517_00220 [Salinivirgaceae bacterium]|jgi:exonuclease III|nr:hypothetical protein [Salinivirgaceae bacterium]